jgi:hypothetical protein
MNDKLLRKFLITREAIIKSLGYSLEKVNVSKTKKGYHFWFHIVEDINDEELCDLQFLLGDDQPRCRYNYLRLNGGAFDDFNVLFSVKYERVEPEWEVGP